jgi:2-dehydro-3-deoxygalactonokinase
MVLPGTHGKWVVARDGRLERFSTFMTGEFYGLLRRHSILARTMAADDGELDAPAFERGVRHALATGNLLHAAFSARTLRLFERLRDEEAPSYLSGLLIGEEVRAHRDEAHDGLPLVLAGSDALTRRYSIALRCIAAAPRVVGAEAVWQGLWSIAQALESSP